MNAPALIPAEALLRRDDRVHCAPYRCTMLASACVTRRADVIARQSLQARGKRHFRGQAGEACATCEAGAARAAQLAPDAGPDTVCSVAGCGAVVTGAKGRDPLCPRHRRNNAHQRRGMP